MMFKKWMMRHAARDEKQRADMPAQKIVSEHEIPAEIVAAIGLALRRYEADLYDMESTVLTINRVARAYSPWSSKIYGILNQPVKISKR